MSRAPFLTRALRLRIRSLVGWGTGTVAFVSMMVAVFPVVRDDSSFDELLAEYPEPIRALIGGDVSLSSGPGFMSAELYSLMLPVLTALLAANAAAALLGGEDERGWLSFVVSGPTTRTRIVVETATAVALVAAVPVVAAALTVVVGGPMVDLGLGAGRLVEVSVVMWVFGVLFGAAALLVAAAAGRRSTAIGAAAGLVVFAYAAEIVGSIASWGRPLQALSPFHHLVATQPAVLGAPWLAVVITLAVAAAMTVVAALLVERRDLVG